MPMFVLLQYLKFMPDVIAVKNTFVNKKTTKTKYFIYEEKKDDWFIGMRSICTRLSPPIQQMTSR